MGLLEPDGGHRRGDGKADLNFRQADYGRVSVEVIGRSMTGFRTLEQADVKGKRVLLRVDLNVPIQDGAVSDATRIERMAPTIIEIADRGGMVILLSHL